VARAISVVGGAFRELNAAHPGLELGKCVVNLHRRLQSLENRTARTREGAALATASRGNTAAGLQS